MLKVMTIIYVCLVAITSLLAFGLYGWDKRQASLKRWRISEQKLHFVALIGGWIGALLGQQFFRHKTQKMSFKLMAGLAVCIHFPIVYLLIFFWTK